MSYDALANIIWERNEEIRKLEAELTAYRALGTVEEIKKRLENSVEVPCKVGADLYCIEKGKVECVWQVVLIEVYQDETVLVDDSDNHWSKDDIGKTIFLTPESAEEARQKELEDK